MCFFKLFPFFFGGGGGAWGVKCGRHTAVLKHQRLTITNEPCKYARLPKEEWIESPGAFANKHRSQLPSTRCGLKERDKEDRSRMLWCYDKLLLFSDPLGLSAYGTHGTDGTQHWLKP